MSLARDLMARAWDQRPPTRPPRAPAAPHSPEPAPEPRPTPPEPAHVHTAPPLDSGPTDVPHRDTDQRWHGDEARALAKLADLTAWCSDPRYAADLMWST